MRAFAIAFLCLVLSSPAMADGPWDDCRELDAAATSLANLAIGTNGEIVMFDHQQSQRFLESLNAQEPVTDIAADRLIAVRMPMADAVLLAKYEPCGIMLIGKIHLRQFDRAYEAAKSAPV